MSSGDPIRRALNARRNRLPVHPEIEDDFAQRVGKELERKGIAHIPGLPRDPEPRWYDRAIELERQQHRIAVEREEAQRREKEAVPLTGAAGALEAAIASGDQTASVRESIGSVVRHGLSEALEGRNE